MAGWSEEGALPERLALTFHGVNGEALERIEIENFQRGLSAPAEDDPGGTTMGSRRGLALTPRQGISVGLGAVLAAVAYNVGDEMKLGDGASFALVCVAFLAGFAILPLGYFLLARRAAVRGVIVTEPFVVEANPQAMIVRGATIGAVTIPIGSIVEIRATPRLGWRDRAGTFTAFPCGATEKIQNVALAARLQEIVTQLQAMAGYRGG